MKAYRYEDLCKKVEAGYAVLISHPATNENGYVWSCSSGNLKVSTRDGKYHDWSYQECEEITGRPYPQSEEFNKYPDEH